MLPLLTLLCLATLVLQHFIHPHGHFAYEEWPGVVELAVFVGILAVIGLARLLRLAVRRDVDYYENDLLS